MAERSASDLVVLSPAERSTPEHKRLRSLTERLDKARARLEAWHTGLARFAQDHARSVAPLQSELDDARRAWALELEQIQLGGRWNDGERAVLDRMILDLCRSLMSRPGPPDPELKALYNRVSGGDHDAEAEARIAALRARLEAETGLDLADLAATSVDELLEGARRRLAARHDEAASLGSGTEAPKKPRARRSAAARKAEADAEAAGLTAREVYRRLAALLHPDRAPADATEAQRQERHDRMAKANAAYAAGDLMTLLELQMRLEDLDPDAAARATEAQIRQMNRVLAQQLGEVEAAIRERESTFCSTYGYLPERRPDPVQLPQLLKVLAREVEAARRTLAHDQRMMRCDVVGTRRLLKQLAQEQRAAALLRGMG